MDGLNGTQSYTPNHSLGTVVVPLSVARKANGAAAASEPSPDEAPKQAAHGWFSRKPQLQALAPSKGSSIQL